MIKEDGYFTYVYLSEPAINSIPDHMKHKTSKGLFMMLTNDEEVGMIKSLLGEVDICSDWIIVRSVMSVNVGVRQMIRRLENYPTDLSCYFTVEESKAATNIKNRFIEILKEELL